MAASAWFVWDPCGLVCMAITYALLCSSNSVVFRLGSWPGGETGAVACLTAYEIVFVLGLLSHLVCMLTDPGATPINCEVEAEDPSVRQCQRCKAPKPPRAHHCSVCNRCILKMDHHCPWVNNCVGARNQKHFVLFLVYVQLQCWLAMGSLGAHFLASAAAAPLPQQHAARAFLARTQAGRDQLREEARRRAVLRAGSDAEVLQCVLVFFVAAIFGLFTCIMLCDQLSNVLADQTGIEGLQGAPGRRRPWREAAQEVMGRGPSWRWLLPTSERRAARVKDDTS
mmetsp:Transcript_119133/g.323208  ORF Transcript_119133/g.323208 Transcript_119133/m.323208 type:complete len:283 (-) Transcript_119133:41-889(-)